MPGTPIPSFISLRIGTPNSCTRTLPQGDATALCNSTTNTYYAKSRAFLRISSDQSDSLKSGKNREWLFDFSPNPARSHVTFNYYLNENTEVELNILDLSGRIIASPVNSYQEMGPYELSYDLSVIPAGVYLCTLKTNNGKETKRMVIIK